MLLPTFVGRIAELGFLRERFSMAGAGNPQTILVEGPAGVGKSALLTTFVRTIAEAVPRRASGDEAETFLRFGILHQLTGSQASTWSHPFGAGADLLQLLDNRSSPSPTVFVVDDAHLADADSMDALTFALRRLRADRVMAVFATRDEASSHLPPGLLRLVDAIGGRLKLAGLTDPEVVEFGIARGCGRISRPAASRLRSHTDGNPLYLGALIDELPAADLRSDGPLPAPQSYALLVTGSLASLSEEARKLARAVAVLADNSLVDVAADVADLRTHETAMEELSRAKMVSCRYGDDGWSVRFLHPLMKAVVYDDLGPTERARLHTAAAARLDGDDALLHLVAAARGPDPSLAAELGRSADALRSRGELHRSAELHLKAVGVSDAGEKADVHLMDAVSLFLLAGDVASAIALSEPLGQVVPSARRFHLQAKLAQLAGKPGDAEDLATQAWQRSDEVDPEGRGALAAILAQLCNLRGDGDAAATWADRALSHDLSSDLADSTAAARAIGRAIAGQLGDAVALLERELPADPEAIPVGQHHQLCARGALRAVVDDLAGARADLAALRVTSGVDLAPNRLVAMGVLALVEYRLGSWDSSLAGAVQTLSLAEDTGQLWIQGFLHTVVVRVAAGRGDWEEAEGHLEAARELAATLDDPATFAVCEDSAVHIASCRGDAEEVESRSALLRSLPTRLTREPGLFDWPVQLVTALVELGRLDEATEEVAEMEAVAHERSSRSRLAALARLRGELATARREHTAARTAFEDSLALGAEAASALENALTQASYGRFLRRRGEKRAAVDRLGAARAAFTALGAVPFVERCDVELSACGVERVSGHPTRPVLTPQEQVVAGLVCEGLTNQEVARQMVLSVKTVGYHLSNIYTKLDVHSRTQLVAVLGPPT